MAIDWFSPAQCVGYAAFVLGRPTAVASSTMPLLRSVLALYTRSKWVALLVIAANLALFLMEGVRMRLAMLCGTVLWIVNNIIAGSVGGTALELMVAAANLVTIRRMLRAGVAHDA